MSGYSQVDRVEVLAPVWSVPATLADFECRHGNLGRCEACELERLELDEQLVHELTVRS